MNANLDSLSPICRYIYDRLRQRRCRPSAKLASRTFPFAAMRRGARRQYFRHMYRVFRPIKTHDGNIIGWMATDRLPCCSTQALILLLAVPAMSRRCLSRTLSTHRRRTGVSCVGPFGKRGTVCGIHCSARPDADSHLSASSTALGHQRSSSSSRT